MKSAIRYLSASLLGAFLLGCADHLPIVKSDSGLMCDGHTGYWQEWTLGTGGRQIQEKCEKAAQEYCKREGKTYEEINSQYSNTQPYTESRAKVTFKCKSQEEEALEAKKADEELIKTVAKLRKVCADVYGFKENTTELNQCVLDIQKERAADARALLNAKIQHESSRDISDQMDRARGQAIMNSVKPTTCTTFGNVTNCI